MSEQWICPVCETLNDGDVCILCATSKPGKTATNTDKVSDVTAKQESLDSVVKLMKMIESQKTATKDAAKSTAAKTTKAADTVKATASKSAIKSTTPKTKVTADTTKAAASKGAVKSTASKTTAAAGTDTSKVTGTSKAADTSKVTGTSKAADTSKVTDIRKVTDTSKTAKAAKKGGFLKKVLLVAAIYLFFIFKPNEYETPFRMLLTQFKTSEERCAYYLEKGQEALDAYDLDEAEFYFLVKGLGEDITHPKLWEKTLEVHLLQDYLTIAESDIQSVMTWVDSPSTKTFENIDTYIQKAINQRTQELCDEITLSNSEEVPEDIITSFNEMISLDLEYKDYLSEYPCPLSENARIDAYLAVYECLQAKNDTYKAYGETLINEAASVFADNTYFEDEFSLIRNKIEISNVLAMAESLVLEDNYNDLYQLWAANTELMPSILYYQNGEISEEPVSGFGLIYSYKGVYYGDLLSGERSGYGTQIICLDDGYQIFEGEWLINFPNGYGTYIWWASSGTKATVYGNFVNGYEDGTMTISWYGQEAGRDWTAYYEADMGTFTPVRTEGERYIYAYASAEDGAEGWWSTTNLENHGVTWFMLQTVVETETE